MIKDDIINGTVVPQDQQLPNRLTVIPLGGRPIFPGIFTPIIISNTDDAKEIEKAFAGDGYIGLVLAKNDNEKTTLADVYDVGTCARLIKKVNMPDGGINVFVSTIKRFKITKALSNSRPMVAAVDYLEDQETGTFETKALTRTIVSEMREISEANPLFNEEMRLNLANMDQPGKIADFVASILNVDKEDQQRVLETVSVRRRLEQVLVFIKKEQEILRVQKRISNEINEKVEKNQREYFLREELKAIQEELGMSNTGKATDYQKFRMKIDRFNFTGEVKETVESELEKFSLMDPHDSEYNIIRNYLELVCSLPWTENFQENFSLDEAKKILEKDHYGLEKVKERIMEFLAVKKMNPKSKGTIMILVGPPGVGKTSIGKSIASAMNRPFYRFSAGGEHDASTIKGHRRTYIGAMPGKIIQGLKIVKSRRPVFMIDEVDKMCASHNGDPSAALLEVLDPEQNVTFRDNYLDLPFDVSDALFILTANTLDSIPGPLLDRAEIIELSGYIDQEKAEIAKKYLIPKTLVKNGFKKNQVAFTKDAINLISTEYAREAGVRNFEKCIDKIVRKLVNEILVDMEKSGMIDSAKFQMEPTDRESVISMLKLGKNRDSSSEFRETKAAHLGISKKDRDYQRKTGMTEDDREMLIETLTEEKNEQNRKGLEEYNRKIQEAIQKQVSSTKLVVDVEKVRKYLGQPVFDESQIKRAGVPGTAIGLAWTSMGGDTLLIESISYPASNGTMILTGQMGDVMQESAQIAFNTARRIALAEGIKTPEWFEKNTIHVHIPEGATPKDGPSAGITMTVTLTSLLRGKTIKPNLAMTGELSLTGQVLPIGGLREKTVAARRNHIKTIIIPKANQRDLDEIPENVKKGIKFIPVSSIDEVLKIAF